MNTQKKSLLIFSLIFVAAFGVLDHFFYVSEYLKGALEACLLVLGTLLLVKGGISILTNSSNDLESYLPSLFVLLAGGAAIAPGGMSAIAVAVVLIGYLWTKKPKPSED